MQSASDRHSATARSATQAPWRHTARKVLSGSGAAHFTSGQLGRAQSTTAQRSCCRFRSADAIARGAVGQQGPPQQPWKWVSTHSLSTRQAGASRTRGRGGTSAAVEEAINSAAAKKDFTRPG